MTFLLRSGSGQLLRQATLFVFSALDTGEASFILARLFHYAMAHVKASDGEPVVILVLLVVIYIWSVNRIQMD